MNYRPIALLAALLLTIAVHGQHAHGVPPTPPGHTVYTAATSGSWNDGSTWAGGATPGPNSVAIIPAGVLVTIDHLETNPANSLKWVRIEGTVSVSTAVSTRFYAETIYVTSTGAFQVGSPLVSIPANHTAEIVFTSPGTDFDRAWDPEQMSRGLIAEGKVIVYGTPRTHAVTVANDVLEDSRAMTLESAPSNWQPNDEIVLAGTYFRRGLPFQDELRRIGSITGTSLTIAGADKSFDFDHLQVMALDETPMKFHVVNLTRNVIFRSQTTTHTYDRGHIMLANPDSQLQWAALIDLGRTNKAIPLDDFTVGPTGIVQTPLAQVNNRRGRYSLHVHKAGWGGSVTEAQTKITGCVARNTPGWGFVNHGSNVDFSQNIAYDFTGAGFVTEDGNELGSFTNNVAIRGKGDGLYLDRKGRINFANASRPQPIADFAFMGDGFWFNGPAIRVNGAIASSLNGNGMIWHTTGAVDPATANATYPYGRYTAFPKNQIAAVYGVSTLQPRTWAGDTNQAVIADLPILECTNVQVYGAFIAFRLRFNNHDSNAWYGELPYRYDLQIMPAPGQGNNVAVPTRLTETISNLSLWNSEAAYLLRYAGNASWSNVIAANRLDFDEINPQHNPSRAPIPATESFYNIQNMTFNGLVIDGWDIANFLSNVTSTGLNITVNSPVYRNFALTGTWNRDPSICGAAPLGAPVVSANSTLLQWSGGPGNYLVRYRVSGAQHWSYVTVRTLSVVVPTVPGKTYVWQVMHGCPGTNTVTYYTPPGTFNT